MRFLFLGSLMAFFLWGCGASVTSRKAKGETTLSSSFFVTDMDPTAGTLAALPASITVIFNEQPDRQTLAALTHYNLNCGSENHAATAVDSVSGISSVTVTLPSLGILPSGTLCTFTASSKILDTSGNPLGGSRSVSYTIQP